MSEAMIKELYDFRQVGVPEKLLELKVSQTDIDQAASRAAERFLTIEPVTDGIRAGDIVALELPDGDAPEAPRRMQVNVGLGFSGEALENALLGKAAGAEIALGDETAPGRIVSVKRRMIPELSDELVLRLKLDGVSTVEEYRAYSQNQLAQRLRQGKEQALCEYVAKAVVEKSIFSDAIADAPDFQLIYHGTLAQVGAMAEKEGKPVEELLAHSLNLGSASSQDCYEELRRQCVAQAKRAAIGRSYAERDGVSYSREDILAQYEAQLGAQASTLDGEVLDSGVIQSYTLYFFQKIAAYYQDKFRTVLIAGGDC